MDEGQPSQPLASHHTTEENPLKRSRDDLESNDQQEKEQQHHTLAVNNVDAPPMEKKIKLDEQPAITTTSQSPPPPPPQSAPPQSAPSVTTTAAVTAVEPSDSKSEETETKAKLMAKLKGVVKKTDDILESAHTSTTTNHTIATPQTSVTKKSSQRRKSNGDAENEEMESATKERRSQRSRKLSNMDDSYELADAATRALVGPFRTCYEILQQLKKHRWAWPFAQPVDIEGLGIHDYLDIVKRPMDLSTVQRNLTTGQYSTVYQFHDDVNLIWSNCMIYNQPGSDVVRMAQALQRLFEDKFKKVIDEIESPSGSPTSRVREMQSKVRDMHPKMDSSPSYRQESSASTTAGSARGRGSRKSSGGGGGRRSVTPADTRPMTFEEKKQLSEYIGQLNNEQLARVVEIIQFHASHDDYSNQTETEIEIDLDQLEPITLRELEHFAKECLGLVTPVTTKRKPKSAARKRSTPAKQATGATASDHGHHSTEENVSGGNAIPETNTSGQEKQPHDTDEETDDDSDSSAVSSGDELDSDSDEDKKSGPQSLSAAQGLSNPPIPNTMQQQQQQQGNPVVD